MSDDRHAQVRQRAHAIRQAEGEPDGREHGHRAPAGREFRAACDIIPGRAPATLPPGTLPDASDAASSPAAAKVARPADSGRTA